MKKQIKNCGNKKENCSVLIFRPECTCLLGFVPFHSIVGPWTCLWIFPFGRRKCGSSAFVSPWPSPPNRRSGVFTWFRRSCSPWNSHCNSPAWRRIGIPSHSVEHTYGFNGRCLEQPDVKIAKLEDLHRDHYSEKFRMEMQDKIDEKNLDLQKQIEKLGGGHTMLVANVAKTLVVGGLQGFDSLHLATEWLTLKMKELQGPMRTGTYMNSSNFQG